MNNLLEQWKGWLPDLLDGYRLSLEVTGISLAVGIPLGLALALMVSTPSRFAPSRWSSSKWAGARRR
jgi:polar amino acid transport system permease protein